MARIAMSGFIVCPACGTRIKAGRDYCLRCFEQLPAEGAPEAPQSWFRSLEVSQGATLILGVVLTLAALLLSALIWENATPGRVVDDVAHPAPSTAKTAQARGVPSPASDDPSERLPILEPGFLDAARSETIASTAAGNVAAAKSSYEKALSQHPDDPETLNNLGQALVRLGKIDEAIPRFERAAALAPEKWAYHFNQAHAASQLLLWDRAVAEYRRAKTIRPTDDVTQFNLAMALHKKGDDAAAIPEFEKAIQLAPGRAAFHVSLAISLERRGRIPEAVHAYQRFLQIDPTSPDAQRLRAHVKALASPQQPASP